MRSFFVLLGLGICLLAGFHLSQAIQQALTTGMVLLGDTKVMSRDVAYPYPWRDAWAFFGGWSFVLLGGSATALAGTGRWRLLFLAVFAFFGGLILISAAPTLGSLWGVFLLGSVWVGASLLALVVVLWHNAREHRKLQMEPELQDRKRSESAA